MNKNHGSVLSRVRSKTKFVTVWADPGEKFMSQYGEIRFGDWCRREMERIRAKGGDEVAMVANQDRLVALKRV